MRTNLPPLDQQHMTVLADLGEVPEGMATLGPENKYWHRAASDLIAHGHVMERDGYYRLTMQGRQFATQQ